MNAHSNARRPGTAQVGNHRPCRNWDHLEPLESRQLMSASWNTVDAFQLGGGTTNVNRAMASDSAGNVYAAGIGTIKGAPGYHGVVREQVAGTTNWATIEDLPSAEFVSAATDSAGNLYVGGYLTTNGDPWVVLERKSGSSAFSIVDQVSGASGGAGAGCNGLATDSAGDVFAVGFVWEASSAKRNSPVYKHWVVRERKAGQASFTTVDDVSITTGNYAAANAVCVVNAGPAAGVYVVGESHIRKSPTGAAGTWVPLNHQAGTSGFTTSIAADSAGRLYVVGTRPENSSYHWIVDSTADGGNTWSVLDDFQPAPGANSFAQGVGTDPAGNVYVVGRSTEPDGTHALVRGNVGGSWQTIDDFSPLGGGLGYSSFASDPSGNVYVGGAMANPSSPGNTWITRSSATGSLFSSTPISGSTNASDLLA